MGWIKDAASGIISPILKGGNNIVKTFKGSQQERDKYKHQKFSQTMNQFSSEFHRRENRTWWDSFWDGFNRMPRPVIVILIITYFLMAYFDPIEFQKINLALDSVPERMWWAFSVIMGFYFVAREFQKNRDKSMALSNKDFDSRLEKLRSLENLSKEKEKKKKSSEQKIENSISKNNEKKDKNNYNNSYLDKLLDMIQNDPDWKENVDF